MDFFTAKSPKTLSFFAFFALSMYGPEVSLSAPFLSLPSEEGALLFYTNFSFFFAEPS